MYTRQYTQLKVHTIVFVFMDDMMEIHLDAYFQGCSIMQKQKCLLTDATVVMPHLR